MAVSYEKYANLRDEKGLNDYQVSLQSGVKQPTFPNWKAGRSVPKVEKLAKIAKLLGVHIEDLLEEADAVPKA